MNIPQKTGFILSLALAFSLPINAAAAEVVAPAASAEQTAVQPKSSMQDLMRETLGDQDPRKCKTMQDLAVGPGVPDQMPGMGMGMRHGCGGMQGHDNTCMHPQHKDCPMHAGMDDKRIDMLEKRMDMMQLMLEMMMRQSGGKN